MYYTGGWIKGKAGGHQRYINKPKVPSTPTSLKPASKSVLLPKINFQYLFKSDNYNIINCLDVGQDLITKVILYASQKTKLQFFGYFLNWKAHVGMYILWKKKETCKKRATNFLIGIVHIFYRSWNNSNGIYPYGDNGLINLRFDRWLLIIVGSRMCAHPHILSHCEITHSQITSHKCCLHFSY